MLKYRREEGKKLLDETSKISNYSYYYLVDLVIERRLAIQSTTKLYPNFFFKLKIY